MNDQTDDGFLEKVAHLIGRQPDEVSDALEQLDTIALLDLTDAVARGDSIAVRDILSIANEASENEDENEDEAHNLDDEDAEDMLDDDDDLGTNVEDDDDGEGDEDGSSIDINPRGKRGDEDEDDSGEPLKDSYQPLRKGERVRIGLEEGIVHITDGPSNTVGVKINGRLRMFERARVKSLSERVVSMTLIPDIKRMQQLAGIMPTAAPAPEPKQQPKDDNEVEVTNIPKTNFGNSIPSGQVSMGDSTQDVNAAIDQLERLLPDLRVGDLPPVRKRINDMLAKLNETRRAPERRVTKPLRENNAFRGSLRDYLKGR